MIHLDISPAKDLNFSKVTPILLRNKKILTHPIINVFIMMQYSKCAIVIILICIFKFIFAFFLSWLALMNSTMYNNNTSIDSDNIAVDNDCIRGDWYWTVFCLTIGTTFFKSSPWKN